MDRRTSRRPQYRQAMRADRDLQGRAVLQADGGERREPAVDAFAGRAVHPDAVLWGAPDEVLAQPARLWGEREARATTAAANGAGSDLSETPVITAWAGTSHLSVSSAGDAHRATRPSLGQRHHIYPSTARIYLSGSDPGLVQSIRFSVGSVGFVRERLLSNGAAMGLAERMSRNLQHRSGGTVHQRGVHEGVGGVRNHDQHGWAGTSDGQYFCGAAVAQREVRRGLCEGLRGGVRGGEEFRELFFVLQSGSSASGFGISNTGSDVLWKRPRAAKTGDATGQSSPRSSLLGDAGAKFFCGKRRDGGKKGKKSKRERNGGLWKLTPPMEIRKQRGFPPRLEKSLAKSARLFHSSHRPHSQDRFTTCFGQRSTLERPLFCLKNGEHLSQLYGNSGVLRRGSAF